MRSDDGRNGGNGGANRENSRRKLDAAENEQDYDDEQKHGDAANRGVAPFAVVRPIGESAEERYHEDDE